MELAMQPTAASIAFATPRIYTEIENVQSDSDDYISVRAEMRPRRAAVTMLP
jgi:hypothetical protein